MLQKYFELRAEIQQLSDKLAEEHKPQLSCKEGCDSCCLSFGVLAVEYYAIKSEIADIESIIPQTKNEEKCGFLRNGLCQIYESRPIICRTHGLPLLNMDEEGENWQLSHCELNFENIDDEYFSFENTYQQDTYNSKLFMLNKEFIESGKLEYSEFETIQLKKLLEHN